jgi:phosphomannomutase
LWLAVTVKKLLEKLPNVEATLLYDDLDGSFPNHEANPLKTETLKDLQKKVVEVGADFGFATDGDADRIGLVDEQGKVVEASFVGLLIGNEVLKSHKHPTMLYDLRSSLTLKEEWERRGAKTAQSKVGHANIKKQMTDVGAAFASELSLHLYFGDAHNIEFPDLALLYLLQILAREQKPLSQLIAPFKKYFHSEELNFKVSDKEGIIKKLEEVYTPQARTVSHLDGLWLQCEWGWFNVRASNTEPLLRLNVEANTQALLDEKLTELGKLIQS